MKIQVGILSQNEMIMISADEVSGKCKYNDEEFDLKNDFIPKAIELVKDWPEYLVNENISEHLRYKVVYNDGEKEYTKAGANATPENFDVFERLIKSQKPLAREERIMQ